MKLVPTTATIILALAMAHVLALAFGATMLPSSLRGFSGFLAEEEKKPRAYGCHKNPQVCLSSGSPWPYCCNNKCANLKTDQNNCGASGLKCKFTTACYKGECVHLSFDKRHCGRCNNRCKKGDYCIYGLCNYA